MSLVEPLLQGVDANQASLDGAASMPLVAALDAGADVFDMVDTSTL